MLLFKMWRLENAVMHVARIRFPLEGTTSTSCHAGQALWAETGTWDRESVCSPVEDGQGDPGNSLEGELTKLQDRLVRKW